MSESRNSNPPRSLIDTPNTPPDTPNTLSDLPPSTPPVESYSPGEKLFTQLEVNEIIRKRLKNHSSDSDGKKFTQEDVNRIVQEHLKKQTVSSEELEQLREQNGKLLTQNSELLSALEAEREQRKSVEAVGREQLRDNIVRSALNSAGCPDIKVAERFLRDEISQNPDGEWIISTPEGRKVPLSSDAIAAILPDTLRKPQTRGGSGASNSPGRSPAMRSDFRFKSEESKLEELRKRALVNPYDQHLMVEYSVYRRKVEEMKRGTK